MSDQDRWNPTTPGFGEGHAGLGLVSAMALLIDRLEAHGALPEGDFQSVLSQTLSHPSIDRMSPDAAVLETLLSLLATGSDRPAL